jgi:hypothetical protein
VTNARAFFKEVIATAVEAANAGDSRFPTIEGATGSTIESHDGKAAPPAVWRGARLKISLPVKLENSIVVPSTNRVPVAASISSHCRPRIM